MKFFTKFFNSIKFKSSLNFKVNIFFLRHMLSTNINHSLIPYFFLPTKNLKIKYLSNKLHTFIFVLVLSFLILVVTGVLFTVL